MELDKQEYKLWEIWSEGYVATGEYSDATKLGEFWANSFDEAVEMYNKTENGQECPAERNTREKYTTEKYYNNRRSNWSIWVCSLFDTEQEARKSFG